MKSAFTLSPLLTKDLAKRLQFHVTTWRTARAALFIAATAHLASPRLYSASADGASDPQKKNSDLATMVVRPKIEYPYEAKRSGITGSGIAVLHVDPAGEVTKVEMAISTGNPMLDRAAISGLGTARFKPGTEPRIKIPITFTTTGGQFYNYYDVKKKKMDDVLVQRNR